MVEFSIVIPAFNEEAGITSSLTQVINFMRGFSNGFEVIVVDDGSTDKTAEKVENHLKEYPQIKLIKNPHKGKAFSTRTGVLMASGKYVLMSDADMATPISELKRLFIWMQDHGFEVVVGSREGIGAKRANEPLTRHIMGRVFNMIVRVLTGLDIQDTQCGFKLFKGEAAQEIFNRLLVFGSEVEETEKPRVSAFDVEILLVAKKLGYKIKEVPISWTYVPTRRVHPVRDSILNFLDVVKIKANDILGKYSKY
uniref:dolichyl-phosphate beta-glucosyltransferase n=1 Tax=candidate division WWE3 bacterium TaxID=2053526 RepID=A0A7C4TJR9_UNCKA